MHSQASHQIASPGPIKFCSLTLLTSPISCATWHINSSNLLPLGGPYALSQEHLAEVSVQVAQASRYGVSKSHLLSVGTLTP